jgi:hypothetical protein
VGWTRRVDPRLRTAGVSLGCAALVLVGCGGTGPGAVELDPPEAGQDAGEATAAPEDEGAGAVTADDVTDLDDEDVGDGPAGEPEEELAALRCDLAASDGSTALADEDYERAVLEANFELELLAMELSADLEELLSGVSDGPTLEAQLQEHRQRYLEVTSAVGDLRPPEGADGWHQRAMGSFDAVCDAIADGLAGSSEGDEDRFDTFVEALTGFPSVLNQLHANAACGPFEAC